MNSLMTSVNAPAGQDATPVTPPAATERPILPPILPVGAFEQISAAGREEVLRQCHIVSEESWWRTYHPVGSSGSQAFDRARAREQRGEVAA